MHEATIRRALGGRAAKNPRTTAPRWAPVALTLAALAAGTLGPAATDQAGPTPPTDVHETRVTTPTRTVRAESVTWDDGGTATENGDDDFLGPTGRSGAEYQTSGQVWERTDLTYGFDNWTPDLSHAQIRGAVSSAFDTWAAQTNLTFTEVADCGLPHNDPKCKTPDIRIRFGTGNHGADADDYDFDGPGNVVAHAYGPAPDWWNFTAAGDIHIDDAETWRTNGSMLDLETVVLHESGHSLGIDHTNASCAGAAGPQRPIMCPVLTGTQRVLSSDDIKAIRALYGAPTEPLPDGVEVAILSPSQKSNSEASPSTQLIKIANGYPNSLTAAVLDVSGVNGCDRPSIPVPAKSVVYSSCPIDPDDYLHDLDTSESLTLTATLSAIGIPQATAGPTVIQVVADNHPFSDVPDWVDPAVDWINYWGLADGYANGTYRPNNHITRAQVVRILWRHAGSPTVGGSHAFSDVPDWVDDAVTWAAFDPSGPAQPLVEGYADGTFHPNEPISRAAAVRLLYRYAGSPTVTWLPGHGFPDVPTWVQDAARWAAHDPDGSGPLEEIVNGLSNGTFGPYLDITRAQVTRMVFRLTDQLVD